VYSSLSQHRKARGLSTLLSLSIVALIFAGALGTGAWFVYRHQIEVSSWPTAPGVVLVSEMRHTTAETADRRYQLAWEPFVQYQYVINGKRFVGERISTRIYSEFARSPDTPPTAKLRAVTARYPVGAPVTVRFNPQHPSFAILEIDRLGSMLFASAAAICGLLSIGLFVAWMFKRMK